MKIILYILLHFLLLGGTYMAYRAYQVHHVPGVHERVVDIDTIYDVTHYNHIRTEGYSYQEGKQSNVAFFPGFPYLWKFSGLDARSMAILNLLIFACGFIVLARAYHFSPVEALLLLSLPNMFFMYVPYSEALFFLPCVWLLTGLSKNRGWLAAAGMFLAGLVRSASNVFIPAIIVMELVLPKRNVLRLLGYIMAAAGALLAVAWIQHEQTGQWFAFWGAQQHWDHSLRLPELPFTSWTSERWLDAFALLTGLLCGTAALFILYKAIAEKSTQRKDLLFSLLYIGGITLFALLFKGGSLFSLNRYLIPTAFYMLAMLGFVRWKKALPTKHILYASLAVFVFFISMHFFAHIKFIVQYLLLTLYVALYLLMKHPNGRLQRYSFYALYPVNIVLQVYLLDQFLQGNFIA